MQQILNKVVICIQNHEHVTRQMKKVPKIDDAHYRPQYICKICVSFEYWDICKHLFLVVWALWLHTRKNCPKIRGGDVQTVHMMNLHSAISAMYEFKFQQSFYFSK